MRPPPPLREIGRFPVVGGTALLALGATLAWNAGVDMTPLMEGPQISMGEYWRLATSILLHVNAFHLIFDLYWLWVLGSLVESTFGHFITFAIVILFAVGSGAAEYAFLDGGVGLSGVGYGLFGMLWVLSRHDRRFEDSVDKNTAILFAAWFFICIALTESGIMRVGNVAHGAGAVLGVLLGYAISGPRLWRVPAGLGTLILFVGSIAAATRFRPYFNRSEYRGIAEFTLADKLLDNGDTPGAVLLYRQSLALRPKERYVWYKLSIALRQMGETEGAQKAMEQERRLANESRTDGAGRE